MGLIQKKDEKDEIDGIQIIERGEGPDGDEEEKIDLVAGTSAEHIAAGTTAEEEDARLEAKIAADAADENCCGRLLYRQRWFWRQGRRLGDPHRGPARFDRGKLQLQRQEERHHRARGH